MTAAPAPVNPSRHAPALVDSVGEGGTPLRLFHFSEDPTIELFTPHTPEHRDGVEPGVWAIDEGHSPLYFFPRQCPRILLWPTPASTAEDIERFFHHSDARMLAHIETCWLDAMHSTQLYRYELPPETFEAVTADAWMPVSRSAVEPLGVEPVGDLVEALEAANVELRLLPSLLPLRDLWETTTLHASGVRLRNAQGWNDEETTGAPPRPPARRTP